MAYQNVEFFLTVVVGELGEVGGVFGKRVDFFGVDDKLAFKEQFATPLETMVNVGGEGMQQTLGRLFGLLQRCMRDEGERKEQEETHQRLVMQER